jgi:hypothetical protein
MSVVVFVNVANTGLYKNVVEAGVGKFRDRRVALNLIEIAEQVAAPGPRLMQVAVFFDQLFEFLIMVHSNSLPFSYRYGKSLSKMGSQRETMDVAAIAMSCDR